MISVNKHSSTKTSKNVFKYTFLTVFGVLILFTCVTYTSIAYSDKEQVVDESSDNELRREETTIYLPIAGATANPSENGGMLHNTAGATHAINEHETVELGNETETTETIVEHETTVTETEEVEVRPNKLYCVIEDGFTSTLEIEYQDYLWEMCVKYNVTEYYELFIAQMYHESTFRTDIISATNDHGLMQINVCNHDWLGDKLGNDDFLDPYNNIEAGVYLMSGFLLKYNDVQKALVCYNRGESAVINGTYSTDYSTGVLYDMTLLVEIK